MIRWSGSLAVVGDSHIFKGSLYSVNFYIERLYCDRLSGQAVEKTRIGSSTPGLRIIKNPTTIGMMIVPYT